MTRVPYTAQPVGDTTAWQDIQYVQAALGGDFDDDDSSMFISLAEGADGHPVAVMTSGSDNIAVSNLYSTVSLEEGNESVVIIQARFQLTWMFPEAYDTDGESHFLPKVRVTDMPCNDNEITPCFELRRVLAMVSGAISNDFQFDTPAARLEPLSCEKQDLNEENLKPSLSSRATRVSGRVLLRR